jgi:hypothetical protein
MVSRGTMSARYVSKKEELTSHVEVLQFISCS